MVFSIIYIILFFTLTVGSCYTDIVYGKIYNKFLFSIGMPLVIINGILTYIGDYKYIYKYLIIVAIVIILSLMMFYLNVWAGGDTKLLIIMALAIPYRVVNMSFLGISLLFYIPILTFLFAYIFIIGDSIRERIISQKKIVKEDFIKKVSYILVKYIKIYFVIVLINYLCDLVFGDYLPFAIAWPITLMISFMAVFILPKLKFFKKKWFLIIVVVIAGLFQLTGQVDVFKMRLLVVWALVIMSSVIKVFANNYDYKFIDYRDLTENMILSTEMSIYFSRKSKKFDLISDESLKSRLKESQVVLIKEICIKNKIEQITIVKKVPLAFFMSFASIILLFGGIYLCIYI